MARNRSELTNPDRRQFFRSLLRAGYAAPAVTTVLLASLQPTGGPSGGMTPTSGDPRQFFAPDGKLTPRP